MRSLSAKRRERNVETSGIVEGPPMFSRTIAVPVSFLLVVEVQVGETVARLRVEAAKKVFGRQWLRRGRRDAIVVVIEADGGGWRKR